MFQIVNLHIFICVKENLLQQKFNKLLVIEEAEKTSDNRTQWKCICDCGNQIIVRSKHLKSGKSSSCGCRRIERLKKIRFKDLTNKKFGRLMVLSVDGKDSNGGYSWKCLCDCGKNTTVSGKKLTFGSTKSCGCIQKEKSSKWMSVLNLKQKKEGHPRWNASISDLDRSKRLNEKGVNSKLDIWRNSVYERDDFSCLKCNKKSDGDLNAHHINSWDVNVDCRYDVNNGITMCKSCHVKFHKIYGYGKNDKTQLNEYLESN